MEDRQMIIRYFDKEKQFNYINNYNDFLEKCYKIFDIDENKKNSLKILRIDEDDEELDIDNEDDFNNCIEPNENNQIIYILKLDGKKTIKNTIINDNSNKKNVKNEINTKINKEIIDNINNPGLITAESQIKNLPSNTNTSLYINNNSNNELYDNNNSNMNKSNINNSNLNNNNMNNNNINISNIDLDYSKIKETIRLENKAFKDEIMNEVKKLNSEMEKEMKKLFKTNIYNIKEFLIGIDEKVRKNNDDLNNFKKNIFESLSTIQNANNKNNSNNNEINQNILLEELKSEINNQILKSNINNNNLISSLNEKIEKLSKQIENQDNIIEKIEKLSKQIDDKNNNSKFETNMLSKENSKNKNIKKEQNEIQEKEIRSLKDKNFVEQPWVQINHNNNNNISNNNNNNISNNNNNNISNNNNNNISNNNNNNISNNNNYNISNNKNNENNNNKTPFYGCLIENENLTLTKNYDELMKMKAYKLEISLLNNGNLPWPINLMIQGNSDNNILKVKTFINKTKEIVPNERIKFNLLINLKNIRNEDSEINLKLNVVSMDKSINIIQNNFLFKLIIKKSSNEKFNEKNNKSEIDSILNEDLFQEIKNRLNDDYDYLTQVPNDLQIRKNIIGAIDDNLKILLKENKEKAINSIVEKLGEEMLGI